VYNPWDRAIVDGQFGVVAPNTTASVQMTINQAQWQKHKRLGVMVVAIENAAGPGEAIVLQASG
jgi:minor extracellular serine protease Vpr